MWGGGIGRALVARREADFQSLSESFRVSLLAHKELQVPGDMRALHNSIEF